MNGHTKDLLPYAIKSVYPLARGLAFVRSGCAELGAGRVSLEDRAKGAERVAVVRVTSVRIDRDKNSFVVVASSRTSEGSGLSSASSEAYTLATAKWRATPVPFYINPTPSSDLTPPTVTLTSPMNGTIVSRSNPLTLTANATDNVGVTKVEFVVNGPFAPRRRLAGQRQGVT